MMWFDPIRRKIAAMVYPEAFTDTVESTAATNPDVSTIPNAPKRDQIPAPSDVQMSDIQMIAELATTLAAHRNWSINTVSLRAAKKGTYLADLVAGRVGMTLARRDRIMLWFAENWAADLEWPADIPRPSQSKEAA